MPRPESFSKSEEEFKRLLSEVERKVHLEYYPLRELGTAIVQACTNCRDNTTFLIQAPTEKERIEREILIFYEFLYFFLHMTLRHAFGLLREPQMKKLQSYLGPVISSTAIDSYFGHWPDDLKEKMACEFYGKLNDAEIEYANCTQLDASAKGEDIVGKKLKVLLGKLASNVSRLAEGNRQSAEGMLLVERVVFSEWESIQFHSLLRAFAESG
jgi:hypothetical protein